MRRKNDLFIESARLNKMAYISYFDRLKELSISMFEWVDLPDTVDSRYMELRLFDTGCTVYFNDEVIGNLCLDCITNGRLDVYGEPLLRRAYSSYNNYQRLLKKTNSVIVWNNLLRTNSYMVIDNYARRLAELERVIYINANAQKTPVMVQGSEKQRLTLMNLYMAYDGNQPFIFGDKNLDINSLKVLKTDAPFLADKLYQLKTEIWNEALTYLGISNVNIQKKERLITDEVTRTQGGTMASRYSRLEARRTAAKKINKMFGTDIKVNYRELTEDSGLPTFGGEQYE